MPCFQGSDIYIVNSSHPLLGLILMTNFLHAILHMFIIFIQYLPLCQYFCCLCVLFLVVTKINKIECLVCIREYAGCKDDLICITYPALFTNYAHLHHLLSNNGNVKQRKTTNTSQQTTMSMKEVVALKKSLVAFSPIMGQSKYLSIAKLKETINIIISTPLALELTAMNSVSLSLVHLETNTWNSQGNMFVQRAKLDSYNKPIPPHDTYILSNKWIKKLYHTICPRKICRHGWSPKNRCDMLYHLDTIDSITKQMKEVLQNCKNHGQVIKKWRRHNRD